MARIPEVLSQRPCPICGSYAYPADLDIMHIDEPWGGQEYSYSYQIKQADTVRLLFSCACTIGGIWWRETYVLSPDGENLAWGYVSYNDALLREANGRNE